tara:strand:+ start:169 stop:555 length:387 start_codon:yes stop_codon:yes gene_type:complete
MATTTVRLTIQSPDLTSDTLSITKSFNLTSTAGVGITQTSGLNRVNGLNSITTIFNNADFSNDEAYLFLSNTDTTKGNQVTLTLGSQKTAVLQGGDSVFMAIDPSAQLIRLTADDAATTVEYQLFHNG